MSMDSIISEVLGQVRGIARDVLQREGVRLRTATVTSTAPLRIRYDGEQDPSVVTPRTTVSAAVGDRVVVTKSRGQATIVGVLGKPEWAPVEVLPGYTAQTLPECRIENGRVQLRGGITAAGIAAGGTHRCMRVPERFRPAAWGYFPVISSNADAIAMGVVELDGTIQIRAASVTGSYYLLDAANYPL